MDGKTAEVLAKAEEVADTFSGNAQAGVWGLIKVCKHGSRHLHKLNDLPGVQSDLYRDTLETIGKDLRATTAAFDDAVARSRL